MGVRPDLLFYIEAAWQRREIERIKARLDLIEGSTKCFVGVKNMN